MRSLRKNLNALLYTLSLFVTSCSTFEVTEFKSIVNYSFSDEKKEFAIDMDSVIIDGIQAPTAKQIEEGLFKFSFKVSANKEELFYKIYFQNEDYKFQETLNDTLNPLCSENFYGSWGPKEFGFKKIQRESQIITDGFRICGNPRNERKFLGVAMSTYKIEEAEVKKLMDEIQSQPDWFKSVQDKAANNKMPVEQQLELDAIFTLCYVRDKGEYNHRWKRNPRMGNYSVMLVVCTKSDLEKIPDYIQDITLKLNDEYVNPFHYFLYGDGSKLINTKIILDENAIRLKSSIDVTKGIFINNAEKQNFQDYSLLNPSCNFSDTTFRTAHMEQFFHAEVRDFKLNTIPVIADVLGNEYTIDDYKKAEAYFSDSQMIQDYVRSSNCPCKTVKINENEKVLEIHNPKSVDLTSARKENVGVKTRIGYTYGKFTAKIKFPSQINGSNVWTGITNAFWMLFQDKQLWNHRRATKSGYAQKGVYSQDAPRSPTTYYSEIDFEMVKTSQYWPAYTYEGGNGPVEDAQKSSDVIVTSTNFDLSCSDPIRFGQSFCPTKYKDQEFLPFRWAPWHQAITTRTPVKNSDLYSPDFYYYQIEWRPNEIIWRIGPSKDQLNVIGYVNDEITSIPNNQMIMIVTQEYHLTEWWPPMPFKQEFIPFLKNDMIGKIFEFEIE
jgi:hypothetical protein